MRHRDTSQCCACFCLSVDGPEHIIANYRRYVLGDETVDITEAGLVPLLDVETFMRIFKYVGKFACNQHTGKRYAAGPTHQYTCTLLQPDGLCSQYEARPHTCIDYPNNGRCDFPECESTWCAYRGSWRMDDECHD